VPVERVPTTADIADVLDRVLDKGIVIDAWLRISIVGLELISIEARVVVASIETYLTRAASPGWSLGFPQSGAVKSAAHTDGVQRRRFPRYRFQKRVTIGVMRGEIPEYVDGTCKDLGEEGAGVSTPEPMAVGEVVELQIPLPIRSVHVPACVRHQSGSDYGFEFLAPGVRERESIRHTCNSFARID